MDEAIVRSIHQIAGMVGLKTIAEFVEDNEIMDQVRKIDIDSEQGYGIELPCPITDAFAAR